MKLKGQTITDAYQEWVKDEIKSTTSQIFNLGKFIFGVSIGSIGFITTLEKFISEKPDYLFIVSIILFVLCAILSVSLILPKNLKILPEDDLSQVFSARIKRYKRMIWIWLVLWLVSLTFGLIGVFILD